MARDGYIGNGIYRFKGIAPWDIEIDRRKLPFLVATTFSSLSPLRDDHWGRSLKRPYQLVLMPGYRPPQASEVQEGDYEYIWTDRKIDKPKVVWDAFSSDPLLEAAYVNFKMDLVGPYIRVWDVEAKRFLTDDRSPELLATRPKRNFDGQAHKEMTYAYSNEKRTSYRNLEGWAYENSVQCNRESQYQRGLKDDEASAWSRLSSWYRYARDMKEISYHSGRLEYGEARLKETHGRFDFYETRDFKSPLRFRFLDLEKIDRPVEVQPLDPAMTITSPDLRGNARPSFLDRKRTVPPPFVEKPSLLRRLFGKRT